ncbi:LytR/AlgR family response regulator transcription factor [Portibacter marinus]|uniref:LytR/AlgR family response regulator transcription factor n=1 Tax=Portibacter marinus TaxID=2898660 RepID=UPI001F21F131|nr:response regulator [Portibacter marinus]
MKEGEASKIMIVEDEMLIAADISIELTTVGYEVVGIYTKAEDVLKALQESKPEIILMDIVLSGKMNGIDAAKEILKLYQTPVIFLTSNVDDATFKKAKEAKPYAFISKPFRKDDLLRAIEITLERMELESKDMETVSFTVMEDRLFVRHHEEMIMVHMEKILFLEASRNYCRIKTSDQELHVSTPMGNIEKLLPNDTFVRTHRSFIVNLKSITSIHKNNEYLMIQNSLIPISRRLRDDVVKRFKMI